MSKRKNTRLQSQTEEFKILIDTTIRTFLQDNNVTEYVFPPTLTNVERAYVHEFVKAYGLKSKSNGKEPNRCLHIYKKTQILNSSDYQLQITDNSTKLLQKLLYSFPVSQKEFNEVNPSIENRSKRHGIDDVVPCQTLVRLHDGQPLVPPPVTSQTYKSAREKLPIAQFKQFLISAIEENQVLLISGETGSGKTTQVPQYILEDACSKNKNCRIFCTQPRRISAVSVAERVAAERGEPIGQSIGYQIRLESRVSPKTALTYCTNGVLLRSLMSGMSCLNTLTHIIVDEIHERDRFSDFLLICLRECLLQNKSIKLILMSATADTQLFQQYFQNLPIIMVPGRQYPVNEFYLEDVLRFINYMSHAMAKFDRENNAKKHISNDAVQKNVEQVNVDPMVAQLADQCLLECWRTGSDDAFIQLIHLIMSENVSVNYQHNETGISGLMVAAVHGNVNMVEQFINLGANANLVSNNNQTALDWAKTQGHIDVVKLLSTFTVNSNTLNNDKTVHNDIDEHRLNLYSQTVQDEFIDYELLLEVLVYLHLNATDGSILIFLAGYDDIITMKNMIQDDKRFQKGKPIVVYTLHSNMQTINQKKIFQPAIGERKIILSTNIAETSVTIEDVVFVIDSGKVKEKNFDASTGVCSLKTSWISQACSRQRAGRAGRTAAGYCFHLFSKKRFQSFQVNSTPEILRMPLHELCLQTKMLAPMDMTIADFLSLAIEPPSALVIRNAVQALKILGALNEDEKLTPLGMHLIELSIEPHLGKIILYGVLLKCLDPILTIVSCLAYREPFLLPAHPSQKIAAIASKVELSCGTYSDHMSLLRAFQLWQSTQISSDRRICERNFISTATMEMVICFRTQLLGQLRAAGFVRNRPPGDIRDLNQNSENWAVIKAALAAGLYPNLAHVNRRNLKLCTQREKNVMFHPSSVLRESFNLSQKLSKAQACTLSKLPSDWVIYDEISRNAKFCIIRGVTLVTSITVFLFTGSSFIPTNSVTQNVSDLDKSDSDTDEISKYSKIQFDNWITFFTNNNIINDLLNLRTKWHAFVLRRMRQPSRYLSSNDEHIVKTIVEILTTEEQAADLPQPFGIGQRPKPFVPNTNSHSHKFYQQYNSPQFQHQNRTQYPHKIVKYNNSQDKLLKALNSSTIKNAESDLDSSASSLFESINQYGNEMRMLTNSMNGISLLDPNNVSTPKRIVKMNHRYSTDNNNFEHDFENNGRIVTDSDTDSSSIMPSKSFINLENSKFFIVKVPNLHMIETSIAKQTWIFPEHLETKLVKRLNEGIHPILIFTVQGSNYFQGVAELITGPRILRNRSSVCSVKWISRANLSFQQTRHLMNAYNNNRRVYSCPDGQEIDPITGAAMVNLFTTIDPEIPIQMDSPSPPKHGRAILRRRT